MSSKVQYIARVLSGVNQGAEALLPSGRPVVIGKSASSDIIFTGSKVAGRHVKIQQRGNVVELIPLAQPVYVDGKDVGLKSIILKPEQIVTVGDVRFAINDSQLPWTLGQKSPKSSAAVEYVAEKRPEPKRRVRSGNLLANPWLWLSVLGLLLVNLHYFAKDSGGLPAMLGITKNAQQQMSDIVSKDDIPGVKVSKLDNGVTLLDGYVATQAEKAMLDKKIKRFGGRVRDRVFVDSNLESNAEDIARSLGEYEVRFNSLEHGRLEARGIINERHRWIEIREIIRNDVEGVISINDDNVVDVSEQFQMLRSMVEARSFGNRIELSRDKATIRVKATLTEDERKDWEKLYQDFQAKTSYQLFKLVEDFSLPADQFDMAIRTVSVGDVPYVVSKQGKKYFVGSHVGKGYYIESINHDNIVLNNNEIEFPVFFGKKDIKSDARN